MNITQDLLHVVEETHSLSRILEAVTGVIAERLGAEGCFVFLLDANGELVRGAAEGPPTPGPRERDDAEVESVAAQAIAGRRVATARGPATSLVASPMLLRDRIMGALVLQGPAGRDHSPEVVGTLATAAAQLVGIVENARIVDALDRGELPGDRPAPRPGAEREPGERTLRGMGASPGIAVGVAVIRGACRVDLAARDLPVGTPAVERARVRAAVEKTRNDVARIQTAAAREIDEEHALIFASHLLFLNDPTLLANIDREVGRGVSAPLAIDTAFEEFEDRLRAVPNAYIRERIDDVDDLRSRLLDHVLETGGRARFGAGIVLTSRIPPSLVVELKTEGAQALITETGGATSHGVLLARAMGLPVITGLAELASVRPGDRLVVDGTTGAVVVSPERRTLERYEAERRRAERARTEHARFRDVPARTADGARVSLHANVGVASDLAVARENGAEGVGLYRTEFPFIVRDSFPTRAEQVRIYARAHEVFPAAPVHFRLLDLGGDKFVAGGHVATSRSAFHGYRSIRVLFDHPDVVRDQVQALALAAEGHLLRILIPMVTSMEDLRRMRALVDEALACLETPASPRAIEIGVMIEVPAAVELAADLAKEADFLSIGTNDLMQYALVVDREDARMAPLSDPYHPAVLRMIARVAAASRAAGKPVGVCGEIAVRPDIALALVALGVDSLSVVPTAIPELKQALAGARLDPMRRAIEGILALSDARSVAEALRETQHPAQLDDVQPA
jgi:phosphotransferase system enzyme I (PtsP)